MNPIDLSPLASLARQLGPLYWTVVGLLSLALVLWIVRNRVLKFAVALLIVAFFAVPLLVDSRERQVKTDLKQARLKEAQAHFEMRCKNAGEKILQTAEGVETLAILNNRPRDFNLTDQFRLNDPYGHECGGDECISGYLINYRSVPTGTGSYAPSNTPVYRFVEATDDATKQLYRYERASDASPLVRTPITSVSAQYGLKWEDISTPEDRRYWIAGGSLKVIDLKTGQVVAERVGYLMDPAQGDRAGARVPWGWARSYGPACPPLRGHNIDFVTKVLKPATAN
jgi:hypothetical protein